MTDQLIEVQLAAIVVSSLNARKNLEAGSEDAGINNLAESIQSMGLLNPPSLRARGDGTFEVVAGQRRVLACQKLGMTTISAFVTDWSDDKSLGASLVENLQRADMHPLDKARGLDELAKRLGSEREAAKNTGLGLGTVKRYISLLGLPEDIRAQLGTGQGPSGVGALAAIARNYGGDDEAAREAWDKVRGFTGGVAENILNQSGGDMDRLEELRQRAVDGELHLDRCGSSLRTCPWFVGLPGATQDSISEILSS